MDELGLTDDVEEPLEPPVEDTPPPPPALSPEELEAEKKRQTAEKRADIVGRHNKWQAQLDETSAQRLKDVRAMLVRVRRACARALWDKADPPTQDPEDAEIEATDLQTMRYIQGERVSLLIDDLSTEGTRLLKGLESYLRKEEKTRPTSQAEAQGRLERWAKVFEKIQVKYQEAVTATGMKLREWFISVKDIEIREVRRFFFVCSKNNSLCSYQCLAASAEVKSIADRGQSDIGLDYAWLDDVTYHDWDNYHKLMYGS
jgi:hypothetical protein